MTARHGCPPERSQGTTLSNVMRSDDEPNQPFGIGAGCSDSAPLPLPHVSTKWSGVLTIDGPSGAGKTTLAVRVAHESGASLLDVGTLYRHLTVVFCTAESQLLETSEAELTRFLASAAACPVNDPRLRTEDVERALPMVSQSPPVRNAVREWQQTWAANQDRAVVVGRVGGVDIFPSATLKVFLTASPEVRAERRAMLEAENAETGQLRDIADAQREVEPLRPAADALIIDTTNLAEPDVARRVLGALRGLEGSWSQR